MLKQRMKMPAAKKSQQDDGDMFSMPDDEIVGELDGTGEQDASQPGRATEMAKYTDEELAEECERRGIKTSMPEEPESSAEAGSEQPAMTARQASSPNK